MLMFRCRMAIVVSCLLLAWTGAAVAQERVPRILVTNDDGARFPGMIALVEALKPLGEVIVVAPAVDQSATGHSIVLRDPIYLDRVDLPDGTVATAVSGTPATTVRVALGHVLSEPPDLVVSGINRGFNFGMNAFLSGTVAGARQAAIAGIPAIASSLDFAAHPDYGAAAEVTARIARLVLEGGLPAGTYLNVNVPAGPADAMKGVRLTLQSGLMGYDTFTEGRTPYGRRYVWPFFNQPPTGEEGTDVWAVAEGWVSVTPLRASEFDPDAFEALSERREWHALSPVVP